MKRKYIIFYAGSGGFGSSELILSRKESIKKIKNLHEIEKKLSIEIKTNAVIINYKFVGFTWK